MVALVFASYHNQLLLLHEAVTLCMVLDECLPKIQDESLLAYLISMGYSRPKRHGFVPSCFLVSAVSLPF